MIEEAVDAAEAEGERLYALGQEHRDRDEWPEALAAFRAALACEILVPGERRPWGSYGMTLHELAAALMQLGDLEGAHDHFMQARAAKERVPDEFQRWDDYGKTLHELGYVRYRLGRHADAIEALRASIAANERLSRERRASANATTLRLMGYCLAALNDWRAAADAHATLAEEARLEGAERDANVEAVAHFHRAYALVELDDFDRAVAALVESDRVFSAIPLVVRDHRLHFETLRELAYVYERLGDADAARDAERRALDVRRIRRSLNCADDND